MILPALPRFIAATCASSSPEREKQATWLQSANGYCRALAVVDLQHHAGGKQRAERGHHGQRRRRLGALGQLQDVDLGDRVLLGVAGELVHEAVRCRRAGSAPPSRRRCRARSPSPPGAPGRPWRSRRRAPPLRPRVLRRAPRRRRELRSAGSVAGVSVGSGAGARRGPRPPGPARRARRSSPGPRPDPRAPARCRRRRGWIGKLASAARILVDCVQAGLSLPEPAVNRAGRRPAKSRAQVKRAPERRPFPRFRDFPCRTGRTICAEATPDEKSGQALPRKCRLRQREMTKERGRGASSAASSTGRKSRVPQSGGPRDTDCTLGGDA